MIYVENLMQAPYEIEGAVVFGRNLKIRKMGKLLKYVLEYAYQNNPLIFMQMIKCGALGVTRHWERKSIIENINNKDKLKQPSQICNSRWYIDTQIGRQEALVILKTIISEVDLQKRIAVIM